MHSRQTETFESNHASGTARTNGFVLEISYRGHQQCFQFSIQGLWMERNTLEIYARNHGYLPHISRFQEQLPVSYNKDKAITCNRAHYYLPSVPKPSNYQNGLGMQSLCKLPQHESLLPRKGPPATTRPKFGYPNPYSVPFN